MDLPSGPSNHHNVLGVTYAEYGGSSSNTTNFFKLPLYKHDFEHGKQQTFNLKLDQCEHYIYIYIYYR